MIEPGNYTNDFFNSILTNNGYKKQTILSFKVPKDILVIFYDNLNENIAKKYYYNGLTNINKIIDIKLIERIKIINTINQLLFFSNNNDIDVFTFEYHINLNYYIH